MTKTGSVLETLFPHLSAPQVRRLVKERRYIAGHGSLGRFPGLADFHAFADAKNLIRRWAPGAL